MNFARVETYDPIVSALVGSTGTIVLMGVLFAVPGLAVGLMGIAWCGRRGMLTRDVPAWSWAARLHYVYVPLLLLSLGGALGSVYGAHRVTRRAIDQGSASVLTYARGYLPSLQTAVDAKMGERRGAEEVTVETLIAEQMQTDRIRNPLVRGALYRLNLAIVHHAMDQVSTPEAARRSVDALRHLDLRNVEGPVFSLLPRTLHATADSFYAAKYLFVWMLFAPFLLIPLAEYGAHHLYRRSRARATPPA